MISRCTTTLLRYFLVEGGVHPDKDVQIRVVPPPEMVANLKAGNVDGYLGPDPFNQRAVYENAGFIFTLSKNIWDRHPCCAFTVTKEFADRYPNTFAAMWRAIVEATHYASDPAHRKEIAAAIAPANYLNQPVTVLEQVLTGKYADGLEKARSELSEAFVKKGTNDHGIAYLVLYTVSRFGAGFLAASVVAVIVGVLLGLNTVLFRAVNPFIQILKPISPLAWMPLLLYTVKDPKWTAVLVVFMAAIWPTLATTAFGVASLRKDYLHVAAILQLSWFKKLFKVILPGAAPTIVNGLRISFGSALVAVVPAEMLLGELGWAT